MCDCLPKMLCVYCIYIYIYHVNKFEARLLFLYLPLKNTYVLKWADEIKHLGNYMNKDCDEVTDCRFKKSLFIGYVNKLRSNFGKMQLSTLISLF